MLPQFLAGMTDEQLYAFVYGHSEGFKRQIAQLCLRAAVGEVAKISIENQKAKEIGLVNYKGVWLEPMHIIPKRFESVIDKYGKR